MAASPHGGAAIVFSVLGHVCTHMYKPCLIEIHEGIHRNAITRSQCAFVRFDKDRRGLQ